MSIIQNHPDHKLTGALEQADCSNRHRENLSALARLNYDLMSHKSFNKSNGPGKS